jgi:TPP-dependent pyruvate/acetoin dehydrogenase alpha subunit
MSITGLKSGAFQSTLEAMRQRLIDKQNAGAAKIAAKGEEAAVQIDAAVSNAEAKIDREVSDVLQDFSEFTNGGPA